MSFRKRLKAKAANLREGGSGSARSPRARQAAKRVQEKGSQAVQRGTQRAKERASDVNARKLLLSALADQNQKIKEPSMADRARNAADARAPIDATLDPAGDPRAMEAFASGGTTADRADQPMDSAEPRDDDPMNVGSGLGVSDDVDDSQDPFFGSGGQYDDDGSPLEFEDDGFFGGDN